MDIDCRLFLGTGMSLTLTRKQRKSFPLPVRIEREGKRIFQRRRRWSQKMEKRYEMSMEPFKVIKMGKKKKTDPENIATLEWLRIKFQNTINNDLS